ncbi:MAG: outer membrane lipoprotein carrier protein LolA [Desulfobulbaceae bacterium]|uniref:Outer membrane lipoprotein carrier protein LolA n=1 Tax=Candidatus Desulfobia pelagia TaxID=2841692 RepID=A0A8J6NEV5_9BACT|nr:outer membrane lipoprotein carrier protein LolA [Candidatus Desulfobia pelagia]
MKFRNGLSFPGIAVVCVTLFSSSICIAGEIAPSVVAIELQKAYERATTFKASFDQSSSLSGMRHRERKGSGTVVIKKPGFMRWDYVTPSPQVLVNDGEKFSLYFAAENQLIITSAREYLKEDLTYAFFTGSGNVLRDFEVKTAPGIMQKKNLHCIQLLPKKQHAQVESLYVWVDKDTFFITQLQMHDHLGTVTDLILSDVVVNADVSDDIFTFEPPADTEIIIQ